MKNKLFELKFKKGEYNDNYWDYDSTDDNFIYHLKNDKGRFINGKRLSIRLEYHKKNKLFNLEYNKANNTTDLWYYNSNTKSYISHWRNFKGRYTNWILFGIELKKTK